MPPCLRPLPPLSRGHRLDGPARHQRLPLRHRVVPPSVRPVRAAESRRAGALCRFARPAPGQGHHADGGAASFFQSALDQCRRRMGESRDGSRLCGFRPTARGCAQGAGLSVEHLQRAGHLRLRGVSARRLPAPAQGQALAVPQGDRPHGQRPRAGQPDHPARDLRRTPARGRHRQELDLLSRLQKIFALGPDHGARLPLHVQQIRARRLSRRLAAPGLHVHRPELLRPRPVPPFPGDDPRQRRAGEAAQGFRVHLRRHGGALSRGAAENPGLSAPEIPAAGVHHGARRGVGG